MKTGAIGIICKAPRPGHAKTRLAASIGAGAAAELSRCFLRDVAAAIEAVPQSYACDGYAVYAPADGEAELREILPRSFRYLLQADAELGKVLNRAASHLLQVGHDCVLLVNSDSPTLPAALLQEAVDELRRPGDRVVLGPACDGGYYLIGLKQAHSRLFQDIPWGTDAVARLTLERAAQIGLAARLLPEWYDIDDAETLAWLNDELNGRSSRFVSGGPAAATRAFLAATGAAAG